MLGYLPNGIHAVEAMLAAASIGAIWSSTSVDFGVNVRTFLYFLIYIYLSQTFIPLCCIKAVINQLYLIWHLRCSLYICGCKLGSSIPVAVLGLLYYISSWSFICSYWRIGSKPCLWDFFPKSLFLPLVSVFFELLLPLLADPRITIATMKQTCGFGFCSTLVSFLL